jgi:hypothetical protein
VSAAALQFAALRRSCVPSFDLLLTLGSGSVTLASLSVHYQ